MGLKKNKVYLIGFMGSGKSTLGKKIAQALQYKFSDLDSYIESCAAESITSIFNTKGETYFRKLESECLSHFDTEKHMVIATGGGTPCFNDNMKHMLEQGCCVYIKMPEGALFQRLQKAIPKRPLLADKTDDELRDFIHQLLEIRETTYLQSQIVIDGMSISTPSLVPILKQKMEVKNYF